MSDAPRNNEAVHSILTALMTDAPRNNEAVHAILTAHGGFNHYRWHEQYPVEPDTKMFDVYDGPAGRVFVYESGLTDVGLLKDQDLINQIEKLGCTWNYDNGPPTAN